MEGVPVQSSSSDMDSENESGTPIKKLKRLLSVIEKNNRSKPTNLFTRRNENKKPATRVSVFERAIKNAYSSTPYKQYVAFETDSMPSPIPNNSPTSTEDEDLSNNIYKKQNETKVNSALKAFDDLNKKNNVNEDNNIYKRVTRSSCKSINKNKTSVNNQTDGNKNVTVTKNCSKNSKKNNNTDIGKTNIDCEPQSDDIIQENNNFKNITKNGVTLMPSKIPVKYASKSVSSMNENKVLNGCFKSKKQNITNISIPLTEKERKSCNLIKWIDKIRKINITSTSNDHLYRSQGVQTTFNGSLKNKELTPNGLNKLTSFDKKQNTVEHKNIKKSGASDNNNIGDGNSGTSSGTVRTSDLDDNEEGQHLFDTVPSVPISVSNYLENYCNDIAWRNSIPFVSSHQYSALEKFTQKYLNKSKKTKEDTSIPVLKSSCDAFYKGPFSSKNKESHIKKWIVDVQSQINEKVDSQTHSVLEDSIHNRNATEVSEKDESRKNNEPIESSFISQNNSEIQIDLESDNEKTFDNILNELNGFKNKKVVNTGVKNGEEKKNSLSSKENNPKNKNVASTPRGQLKNSNKKGEKKLKSSANVSRKKSRKNDIEDNTNMKDKNNTVEINEACGNAQSSIYEAIVDTEKSDENLSNNLDLTPKSINKNSGEEQKSATKNVSRKKSPKNTLSDISTANIIDSTKCARQRKAPIDRFNNQDSINIKEKSNTTEVNESCGKAQSNICEPILDAEENQNLNNDLNTTPMEHFKNSNKKSGKEEKSVANRVSRKTRSLKKNDIEESRNTKDKSNKIEVNKSCGNVPSNICESILDAEENENLNNGLDSTAKEQLKNSKKKTEKEKKSVAKKVSTKTRSSNKNDIENSTNIKDKNKSFEINASCGIAQPNICENLSNDLLSTPKGHLENTNKRSEKGQKSATEHFSKKKTLSYNNDTEDSTNIKDKNTIEINETSRNDQPNICEPILDAEEKENLNNDLKSTPKGHLKNSNKKGDKGEKSVGKKVRRRSISISLNRNDIDDINTKDKSNRIEVESCRNAQSNICEPILDAEENENLNNGLVSTPKEQLKKSKKKTEKEEKSVAKRVSRKIGSLNKNDIGNDSPPNKRKRYKNNYDIDIVNIIDSTRCVRQRRPPIDRYNLILQEDLNKFNPSLIQKETKNSKESKTKTKESKKHKKTKKTEIPSEDIIVNPPLVDSPILNRDFEDVLSRSETSCPAENNNLSNIQEYDAENDHHEIYKPGCDHDSGRSTSDEMILSENNTKTSNIKGKSTNKEKKSKKSQHAISEDKNDVSYISVTDSTPFILRVKPGKFKPPDSSYKNKLIYTVIKGVGKIEMHNKTFSIYKDATVCIPKGSKYVIHNDSKEENLVLYSSIVPEDIF